MRYAGFGHSPVCIAFDLVYGHDLLDLILLQFFACGVAYALPFLTPAGAFLLLRSFEPLRLVLVSWVFGYWCIAPSLWPCPDSWSVIAATFSLVCHCNFRCFQDHVVVSESSVGLTNNLCPCKELSPASAKSHSAAESL